MDEEKFDPPEPDTHTIGFTIRHNVDDDPNIYGEAPDVVSACVLAAGIHARTGMDVRVADDVGSTAAWIGRTTD